MTNKMQTAAKEILSWLETDAAMSKCIEDTYKFKAAHNRDMPTFGDWLVKIWIPQYYTEAEEHCGGYTLATVRRIAEIGYKGVGIAKELKQKYGIEEVYSYVEEGRVNLTALVQRTPPNERENAERVRDYLRDNGYADATCIFDYDDEVIPVSASRKFIPPRVRSAGKEVA